MAKRSRDLTRSELASYLQEEVLESMQRQGYVSMELMGDVDLVLTYEEQMHLWNRMGWEQDTSMSWLQVWDESMEA